MRYHHRNGLSRDRIHWGWFVLWSVDLLILAFIVFWIMAPTGVQEKIYDAICGVL